MSDIMDFSPLWGEWHIKEQLGRGTYGSVYKAEKNDYGNTYLAAIKHLSIPSEGMNAETLLADGLIPNKNSIKAFYDNLRNQMINEINMCYALKGNTNIVSYEDHCIVPKKNGLGYDIFIRMEYLTSLPKYMLEHQFRETEIIRLGKAICEALSVLESHHILHRDIKPANIFVNSMGVFKLGDFGESKVLSASSAGMTVRGTYGYMSPEISKGAHADITSDLYSLGIVLYRLLNHNLAPFMTNDLNTTTAQTIENANLRRFQGDPLPLPMYHSNRGLTSIIMKACEYDPKDRWQSPLEMKKALEALENHSEASLQQIIRKYYYRQSADHSGNGTVPPDDTVHTIHSASSAGTPSPGTANQKPNGTQPPKKKKKSPVPVIIILSLATVAMIVLVIVIFSGNLSNLINRDHVQLFVTTSEERSGEVTSIAGDSPTSSSHTENSAADKTGTSSSKTESSSRQSSAASSSSASSSSHESSAASSKTESASSRESGSSSREPDSASSRTESSATREISSASSRTESSVGSESRPAYTPREESSTVKTSSAAESSVPKASSQPSSAVESSIEESSAYVLTKSDYFYFDNSQTKWKNVYACWWNDAYSLITNPFTGEPYPANNPDGTQDLSSTWPGVQMERIGNSDIYRCIMPLGASYVIFNSGVSDKEIHSGTIGYQTTDLSLGWENAGSVYRIDTSVEAKAGRGVEKTKYTYQEGNWYTYTG